MPGCSEVFAVSPTYDAKNASQKHATSLAHLKKTIQKLEGGFCSNMQGEL